ncbi:hypothetical protein H0H92_001017 [Tricholoma furcatifolium]|nr:hypothetical protein H0H92_001017 [Tricholoma furcatifolium]
MVSVENGIGIYPVCALYPLEENIHVHAPPLHPESFANFSITTSGKVTTIKVTLPGATEPFFHVQTKPVTLLSRISMPLTLLLGKSTPFVQPRLPAGERPEEIATDAEWASFAFSTKGSAHLERIVPQMDGGKVGDGKNFPAIVPWSFGVYAPHAEFDVAESVFASDTLS